MASTMDGVITIVQESRFQLTDDAGVGHLFTLSPYAAAETDQLPALRFHRVRVHYDPTDTRARNTIGNIASAVSLL